MTNFLGSRLGISTMHLTITLGITGVGKPSDQSIGLRPTAAPQDLPTKATVDDDAHKAATSPKNGLAPPSADQQRAGNYKVGPVKLAGLDISIENPAGSTRSGTDGDGKPWSVVMKSHYGYILGTKGRDNDHLDCFVRVETPRNLLGSAPVFIIDQTKAGNGHFDEYKIMIGWKSKGQARRGYLANYAKGWDGLGAITEMTLDAFKDWLRDGDTMKPAGGAT